MYKIKLFVKNTISHCKSNTLHPRQQASQNVKHELNSKENDEKIKTKQLNQKKCWHQTVILQKVNKLIKKLRKFT